MVDFIPNIGFGTWKMTGETCTNAVATALEVGYRHIDTAQGYGNEAEVGTAIAASGVPRDEIFVTTKVMPENFTRLVESLEESLEKLGTGHVDLALIHWPSPNDEVPLETYLGALVTAREKGLTKKIGVSNFTVDLLERSQAVLGGNVLATNQVELHPFMQNCTLAAYCERIGLPVTAYLPLAGSKVMDDPTINAIARRHEVGPNHVSLAWLLQKGYVVIPKSAHPDRIRSNFSAPNLVLTDSDIAEIDALDHGERIISPPWAPDWD